MSHPEHTETDSGDDDTEPAADVKGGRDVELGRGGRDVEPAADVKDGRDVELGREDDGRDVELGRTVAGLAADDLEPAGRRELLGRLVGDIRRRGLGQLFRPKAALRWMTDVVADVAPHIPVRDRATLRRHFPGLDDDDLAERLIRNATRSTAGVGAVGGGVASVEWAVAPTLLSAPVLLAAETVTVVAVELKLIGELHEVYGRPIAGGSGHRAVELLQAWSQQRGVNPLVPGGALGAGMGLWLSIAQPHPLPGVGVATVLGTATRKDLQARLLRRFGRNLTTMGPLFTGAAVAGYLNRRATRHLGDHVRKDLKRGRQKIIEA